MTLYEKFKKLNIDFSQLSLAQRSGQSGYFCTPKDAEIIGWAGVDGIHCCFVKGFGETVFAVNPSNLPGEYVHPLARSFEDFLRLLLACGLDAAEQSWIWNRGEFEAFLETYPPRPEQQAVWNTLQEALGLSPMDDPYGYIQEVQSGFDYSKILYPKEYYELMPNPPETQEPPERPEWKVYFEGGFSFHHAGRDKPRKEIPIHKTFSWSGRIWHIPAAYVCGKGLVMDLCMEINPTDFQSFLEKWCPHGEVLRTLTPEDEQQRDAEHPMNLNFTPKLTVNGRELRRTSGNGLGWIPLSCRPESERGNLSQQDQETLWMMEHYGLAPDRVWMFWRESFPWATKTKPVVKNVSLSLEQCPVRIAGPRFTVSGSGDSVPFIHPVTGDAHILHIVEYEAQETDANLFQDKQQWEYPTHYTAMSYFTEPDLPRQSLTVRDCGEGDRTRLKQPCMTGPSAANSVGIIIGGADGPTTIMLSNGATTQTRSACSSLYFEPPETIVWRMVFYQKAVEDISLDLPLP